MLFGLDKYYSLLKDKLQTLTQSIILTGQNGIGKKTMLLEVLSESVNNMDNVHIIKSEEGKRNISIEQIRDLFDVINIMPYNDSRHYIVIDNAEQLNDVSFNSILKRLEEPKSTELFILITSDLDSLTDTIKSRCLIINIELDNNVIKELTDKIQNEVIKDTLLRLGFSYVIDYVNNDGTKAKFTDAYNYISELLSLRRTNKLGEYSSKFIKNLDVNLEMLMSMNPNEYNLDIYNKIKKNLMNTQILIEILIYHIVQENTRKE